MVYLIFILGIISIINLVSRPIPSAREWLRMESQVGRYCHHNLLCLSWAEIAFQYFQDTQMGLYHYVINDVLGKDPFVTDV